MNAKCTEFSRYRMRSRVPLSTLSSSNSRSRLRVLPGAQLPTTLIWGVSFIRTRTPSPSCGEAWNFSTAHWSRIRSSVVRGLELQRRGCGWPIPLCLYPKVRDAAMHALQLNDQEAEAHVYLAEAKRILDWDLDGAEAEFKRAVEIEPNSTPSNYFIAAFYAARGDRDKALTYLQRTSKIDPASLWVNNFACELYRYFGLYDEATEAGQRALQLDPTFAHYGEPALAALYRETGRFDDAIALYEKAREFTGRPGFGLAITYARMKRRKEALATLNTAIAGWGYRAGDAIAHVHVTLGAHDDAIRELEHACEQRSSSLHGVGIAPEFVPLRSDKRFRSILERIGLEPEKVFAATRTS